jgi:sulfate permease, SulP family
MSLLKIKTSIINEFKSVRLLQGIRPVTGKSAVTDSIAGVELAAMNIPQALGYAKIAGVPVVAGMYTLLLPLLAFAIFGSSRYLVVAADSGTAAILGAGLSTLAAPGSIQYVDLACGVALLTSLLLFIARGLRLGFLADFLSRTVLVGFLTGVGLQVGIAVLGEMFGIQILSHKTLGQVSELARGVSQIHAPTVIVSLIVFGSVSLLHRFAPRFPAPLIAVIGTIGASAFWNFSSHGISIMGPVTGGLPNLSFPQLSLTQWYSLLPLAFSCAVVILAQSSATARVYANRHRQHLDENADLVGLAAANALAGICGAFVVNGSPTQTAMVESSGGRSQFAMVSTATVVALILLFLTPSLQYLPHCALGALVFYIAVRLIDFRGLRDMRRESPGEFSLAIATVAVVVFAGVEEGILLAIALSLLRIVWHSYHPHTGVMVPNEKGLWRSIPVAPGEESSPGLVIYRFGAALFYANAGRFSQEIRTLVESCPTHVKWLVVDAEAIAQVDYSAARVVAELVEDLKERGVAVLFARVQPYLQEDMDRHHLTEVIGADRIFVRMHEAMSAIAASSSAGAVAVGTKEKGED